MKVEGEALDLGKMEIEFIHDKHREHGMSCNFCSPNKAKFVVRGSGLSVRFCQACWDKIKNFRQRW